MQTQTEKILKLLRSGKSITAVEALNLFGCFRLAARIKDIKDLGNEIEKTMITKNGKKFASYYLKR